jgi:hypothetical protein
MVMVVAGSLSMTEREDNEREAMVSVICIVVQEIDSTTRCTTTVVDLI